MEYKSGNNYQLRDITKEIEARKKEEGKYVSLSAEESQEINNNLKENMIKAKREHTKNQLSSRIKSAEIIFNA